MVLLTSHAVDADISLHQEAGQQNVSSYILKSYSSMTGD